MTREQELEAEVGRLRALVATFAAQQVEIDALIERWRQERQATEATAERLAAKVAQLEARLVGRAVH